MIRPAFLIAALLAPFVLASAALAQSLPAGIGLAETAKGKVLADANGMSLYSFDEDKGGVPSCYEKCAEKWPPLKAAGPASGDFTVVPRSDGPAQWAYKGKPLYTWHKDKAPGDVDGDGFRDVWHLVKP